MKHTSKMLDLGKKYILFCIRVHTIKLYIFEKFEQFFLKRGNEGSSNVDQIFLPIFHHTSKKIGPWSHLSSNFQCSVNF